jgi:hypothetical protein
VENRLMLMDEQPYYRAAELAALRRLNFEAMIGRDIIEVAHEILIAGLHRAEWIEREYTVNANIEVAYIDALKVLAQVLR